MSIETSLSFSKSWEIATYGLQNPLGSQRAIDQILKFTRKLPEDLPSNLYCLEIPSNGVERWIDWGFLVETKNIPFFCALFDSSSLLEKKSWRDLHQFLRDACTLNFFEKYHFTTWSLGFDSGSEMENILNPNLFLYVNKRANFSLLTLAMLSQETSNHLNLPFPTKMQENLEYLEEQCNRFNLSTMHFGILFGRQMQGFRFNLKPPLHMSLNEMQHFFTTIGCKIPDLEETSSLFSSFRVGLDVGENFGKRIGIKCIFSPRMNSQKKWGEVLQVLEKKGLVTDDRIAALEEWQGGAITHWNGEAHIFKRSIDHVKFIFQDGKIISSKLYLKIEKL